MPEKKLYGLVAEFDTPHAILTAAEKVRDAGFKRWDVHTPFPVHGMDEAMGLPPTKLPWIVFIAGVSGAAGAMLLQWWTMAVDYPVVIAGKPFFSWPAFVPITFEGGILLGSFGAVLGMLHLCRLPRHHHPVLTHERFTRASDDTFFIAIEADDPKFDAEKTATFLEEIGGTHVLPVED